MLARHKSKDRSQRREFLAFRLGGEIYGTEVERISAILRLPPITPVPRAPDGVMGIITVRGKVVALMDVRPKLRLPRAPASKLARVLLVPIEGGENVGLFVEEVLQVCRLSSEEIEPAQAALGSEASEHMIGIGRQNGDMLVLVDITPMLRG
jgi:purine-binding chemotaxis protein CheW